MFDALPPEIVALRTLLADLQNDLEGRVERLRLLLALEFDFGDGRGLLLPGGTPAHLAFLETRHAFVLGNFLSVVMLSPCVLENVLAAQLGPDMISAEVHGTETTNLKQRPAFKDTIKLCRKSGLLNEEDERDLIRLAELRNSLAHFRAVDDPSHIDRRAIEARRTAESICETDARFAIALFTRIVSKPAFRFKLDHE